MKALTFIIVCLFSSVSLAEVTMTLNSSRGDSCSFRWSDPMPTMTVKEFMSILDARVMNIETDAMEWWDRFVYEICKVKNRKEKK